MSPQWFTFASPISPSSSWSRTCLLTCVLSKRPSPVFGNRSCRGHAETHRLRGPAIPADHNDHHVKYWAASLPQTRDDFLNYTECDADDSVRLSKWRQNSIVKDSSLSFGLTPNDEYLDNSSFFESALGEWANSCESFLCSSTNLDAIEPESEAAGPNPLPEKKEIDSLKCHSQSSFQTPDLGSTIDFNPTSDFDIGLNSYSSLSFSDGTNSTAPTTYNTFHSQHFDSFSFNGSTLLRPQTLPSSNSSLVTSSSKPSSSCPPLTLSSPPKELQPSTSQLPQMPLPRLSYLKCLYCPRLMPSEAQLRYEISPLQLEITVCPNFNNRRHLTTHKSQVCEICHKILADIKGLQRHQETVHRDKFPGIQFVCVCGYQTSRRDNHRRHLETCGKGSKKRKKTWNFWCFAGALSGNEDEV